MSDPTPTSVSIRGAHVITCALVTVILATFVVILRFITRSKILHFLGYEDWCIGIALLFSFGNSIGMILQAEFALGHHIKDISSIQITEFLKSVYFTIISYNISLTFAKISILLLYIRSFNTRKIRIACLVQLAIVATYGLWLLLSSVLSCVPVAAFWDQSVPGHCLPRSPIWFANAGLNIATDVLILVLPVPVIHTLFLPKRQKIGLYLIFTLGFLYNPLIRLPFVLYLESSANRSRYHSVCIISVLRLHSLQIASISIDPTWDNIGVANWSCIELNTAIICPCLTTLKPLISRLFPRLLSTDSSRKFYHQSGSGVDAENRTRRRRKDGDMSASSRTLKGGDLQSDTDILYAEDNFDLENLRGEGSLPSPKGDETKAHQKTVPVTSL
ncbi:hypothetical protein BGZ60DRAFT_534338 [Tricladium varicosporioides]|nr:hypothetical protein BGZ60DRAFT_534338 [Hymenoscyphus varicosporioides]